MQFAPPKGLRDTLTRARGLEGNPQKTPATRLGSQFSFRKRLKLTNDKTIGIGIVEMGGGRSKPSDSVNHSVGITNVTQIGEEVGPGARPLATIHARDEAGFRHMSDVLASAMTAAGKIGGSAELVRTRIAA